MGKKKSYKSKFSKKWLEDPSLQSWIQPSTEEGQTAYCPYCDGHLNGSKTLMQRHAQNHKHIRNMNAGGVKVTSGNQSSSEPDLEAKSVKLSKSKRETKFSKPKCSDKLKPKEITLPQKWLSDPLLSPWIAPGKSLECKAYCKLCQCGLQGKKTDMVRHASSSQHKESNIILSEDSIFNNTDINYEIDNDITEDKIGTGTLVYLTQVTTLNTIKAEPEPMNVMLEEKEEIEEKEDDDGDELSTRSELDETREEIVPLIRRKPKSCKPVTVKSSNKKTIQDCRKDPSLRKWMGASSEPGHTAYCIYCRCNLRGSKQKLLNHASSSNHKMNSKTKKKSYDQKFNPGWLSDPFLKSWIARSETKTAYCKKCDRHLQGSKTLMYRHAQNPRHLKAIAKTPRNDNEVKSILRVSAFIAEHDLPPSIMNHFPSLLKAVATDSDIVKTVNCTPDKTEFLIKNVLAIDRLNDLSNKLTSTVFSIIVDESTDIFSNKSLAFVVRYYDEDTRNVENSFLTIIDVPDVNNLFQSILDFFASINVPITNLLGFAADSINVLAGKYSATQIRLGQINPFLYVSGCVHHSFQYCVSEACTKFPASFEKLCHDIHDYMHYMPQQVAGFEQIYPLFTLEIQDMIRYSNIKWLSVGEVVTKIVEHWDILTSYFNVCAGNEQDSKAHQILIILIDPMTKLVFLFLNFFLPTVDDLNLEFQGTKYCLHSLLSSIADKIKMILKFYMKASYVNETNPSDLNPVDETNFLVLENMYFGTRVEALTLTMDPSSSYEMILHFKGHCLNFYMEFCTQLLERVDFKDPVLKHLFMLNPEICKSDLYLSIRPMAMLFPNVIEQDMLDQLESEWWNIKSSASLKSTEESIYFWNKVFQQKSENMYELKYPMMTKLVKAFLCLPHSSEATKDTFTAIRKNNIKTRDKYDSAMMSSLLLIKEKLRGSSAVCFEVSDALLCLAKASLET